jgi:hypothetical protein
MSYINLLPEELISIIASYVNYEDTVNLKLSGIKVDYKQIIAICHPFLYEIVSSAKSRNLLLHTHSYEDIYREFKTKIVEIIDYILSPLMVIFKKSYDDIISDEFSLHLYEYKSLTCPYSTPIISTFYAR